MVGGAAPRRHYNIHCGEICWKERYGGKDRSNQGLCSGDGPQAHLQRLAECIRWSYGAGIVLRLGNIARLELNYCVPMGVQSGDRYACWLLRWYWLTKIVPLLFILSEPK